MRLIPRYIVIFVFITLTFWVSGLSHAGDYNFSSWKSLERAVLKELKKIQELKSEVRALEKEYGQASEKYHKTEDEGWKGWFNPKRKARNKMDEAHDDLVIAESKLEKSEQKFKKLLTSTPPGNRLRGLMKFKANQEAIELANSLEIVRGIVESLVYGVRAYETQSRVFLMGTPVLT